jgi:ABC-2 type transport system ATP-binding protein
MLLGARTKAFSMWGWAGVRCRAIGTYSLGMKQAAELAQAIAHGPKLLFLDEPTSGLDRRRASA